MPAVQIVLDERECASRASALGVNVNTLLAAFSARLGFRLGRVDRDGRVKLVMPVSDRTPGDLRANALRAVTVMVDPSECCEVLATCDTPSERRSHPCVSMTTTRRFSR